MLLQRLRTLHVTLLAAVLVACEPTGPGDLPRVTVGAAPHVAPGGQIAVFVTAIPPSGGTIDRVRLEARGLVTLSDSVSGSSDPISFARSFGIPAEVTSGEVVIIATARSGSSVVTDTARVEVADPEPPEIETLLVRPFPAVNPGEAVEVTVGAWDEAGLRRTVLRFSGAFEYADSVEHAFGRAILRSVSVPMPANAIFGATLTITAEAVDAGGHRTTRTVSTRFTDTRPPHLSAQLIVPRARLSPGDTLRLSLTASDSYRLDRVEYRIGSPPVATDTFHVTGPTFNRVVTHVVDESWNGKQEIVVTARDAGGNVDQVHFGSAWVVRQIPPGPRSLWLGGAPRDFAYDAKRNVFYVSLPDANRVGVISLGATPSLAPLLESLPRPFDIDLTAGGDTLLIAPRGSRYLYSYDLVRAQLDSLLIIQPDTFWIFGLDHVRAMANGVALVTVTFNGSGAVGKLMSVDLSNGTVRIRRTVGSGTVLIRSGDARRGLFIDGVCCPQPGSLYDAATDQFSADRATISHFGGGFSSDAAGSRFLISSSLFDADLSPIREYQVPERFFGTSVISPDGAYGYLATQPGLAVVRLSDGVVETLYLLNGQPSLLFAMPNGRQVLAVVGATLHVIDLQ
jgi:hypothetical protein